MNNKKFYKLCEQVKEIADKAVRQHGEFASLHEAYGVIAEEFHEFAMEVFKKHPDKENTKEELLQIAAMCFKGIDYVNSME